MILLFFLLLFADPAQFQTHMKEGVAAMDRGDVKAARDSFQAAVKLNESDASAWFLLAQALAGQRDVESARVAAAKAETLGFDDPRILQGLANFYVGVVPDLPNAAKLGERYAEKAPEDPAAWRKVAALYVELGQTDDAIRTARRGLEKNDTAELHALLGRALVERKEFSAAHLEFDSAIRLNPYDEDVRFRQAQAYLLEQDFAHAAATVEDAKKIFAKSAQLELTLGVAYYGQRKFEPALTQFLRTMQLAPDVPQAYAFLGRILEHAGDRLPEIEQRFDSFRKRNPESALGYLLSAKAMIAAHPEREEEAASLLRQALKLQEGSAEAHYLSGLLLEKKREFAQAAAELERSVQLNPNDSTAHFRLARVYDRLGRREDAERERALHEKLNAAEKAAPPK